MSSRRLLFLLVAATVAAIPARGLAQTVITQWNFNAIVAAPDNSPAPTTGVGTATPLGMTNSYTYTSGYPGGATLGTGSVTTCDILQSAGVANPAIMDFTWRVRGAAGAGTTGSANNGWNQSAPQYSQGAEFDASTAGYSNIKVSYNWYSTTHGVRDLQEQYTLDGSTWNNINGLQLATGNDYQSGTVPNLTMDFSGIPGANNNPSFGIRLVSAYDPTYVGAGAPAYTDATAPTTTYNNNSGNWRFSDITFTGTAAVPEPSTLMLGGAAAGGLALVRRRRTRKAEANGVA
jgi:hypothetical protein